MTSAMPMLLKGATLLQGIQQFSAAGESGDVAQQQADFEAQQLEIQMERERAQAATEATAREDRLKRALARQRAIFGASGVDASSGSALRLQETAIGSINREAGAADFFSSQNILSLNAQKEQSIISAQASKSAASRKQGSSLLSTFSNIGKQFMEDG